MRLSRLVSSGPRATWAFGAVPLALALVLALGGCGDSTDKRGEQSAGGQTGAPGAAVPPLRLERVGFEDLPGWRAEDFEGALMALRASCARVDGQPEDRAIGTEAIALTAGDFATACAGLPDTAPGPGADAGAVRHFFQDHFVPYRVLGPEGAEGLFTGYFEAELMGSRMRTDTYDTPIYGLPEDLIVADLGRFSDDLAGERIVGRVEGGRFVPYPDRGAIEGGYLAERDLELLWIDDPVDVFLLQVQGSGRVILPDGEVVRVGFAGHNGRPYRSIGRVLIERGDLAPHAASWDGIRGWITENPEKARALFAENPRFVFFREVPARTGPGQPDGPIGAQGVPLTPGRSLAVDRGLIPLGLPVWLDTTRPGESDAPLRRLMVAQDTGGAIKGAVRGDYFWGHGDAALAEAGRMRSRGAYYLLLPEAAATRRRAAPSS
ncbi:MltA domain-containing protein [Marivibrio halodurans]|uniref:peptidoglycan lytic exotransglycosylase n=1 Tax=Marivibrio halodurans TaxID=2039722 RepID=A0A8J7SP78_9PROT|nr:MltA domain-containing protein [Marivibrio halodurans]MBP5858171.1 MltA domain-containing protein [Marivibrio halodurans]